jgi:hypothetical protein
MFQPALVSDDVSPLEAHLDRMYWSSLLNGRMMPGLGLAATHFTGSARRPFAFAAPLNLVNVKDLTANVLEPASPARRTNPIS